MYSRVFGGKKSDGQLYNYEREYNESRRMQEPDREQEYRHTPDDDRAIPPKNEKNRAHKLDFLREMRLDDLILIGIGLLLLLDSDGENDIFAILIALLLFF